MRTHPYARLMLMLMLAVSGLLLVACGGGSEASTEPTPTSGLAATPLSTHVFKQPTSIIKESASEEEKQDETPADEGDADLSRGERIFNNNQCADCHGGQGEGVPDKAEGLAGTQLTEAEFADILRTGGQGELGNDHLFGPQAISPSGMEALYTFVKSFE